MASNTSSKTKPALTKCKTYEDWLKLIKLWRSFTDISANRQGSALLLSLEDEALDAVLEMYDAEIVKDDGVYAIINGLNKLFKKDSTITKHQTLEAFETFRSSNMSIQAFLNEFNKTVLKPNPMALHSQNAYRQRQLPPRMEMSQNSIKYPKPNCKRKNSCDRNGVQLRFHICECIPYSLNCLERSGT